MTVNSDETLGQVALYCGWIACRKPIVQEVGPGRRKEFCSEACRRAADRDYKRAKTQLRTFEEQLRLTQHEVAAYGRKPDEGMLTADAVHKLQVNARLAFVRAATVVELNDDVSDRFLDELRDLVRAMRPLLESEQVRMSA